jgi:hypothetical protein
MGLQELRYATSIFFLVFTFFLSLRFDLWSFVAYRSSQRLILTHIAVAKEGVCCMSLLVCLILTLAFVSYFRLLYSLCLLLHTAIQEPGFDAYRSGFRGSLLHVVVQDA